MNIKELEQRTGITKQNIRFYEKKELLSPQRNPVNDYREYTEADVERLQMIKIFRKLDVSIEDIKRLFREEVSMETVMERHMEHL